MFDFENIFVFDLANNHQGDVNHALKIIEECSKISKRNDVRVAFKFQFRQLNTFIHPEHQVVTNSKHLKRFKDTELSIEDYKISVPSCKKCWNDNYLYSF